MLTFEDEAGDVPIRLKLSLMFVLIATIHLDESMLPDKARVPSQSLYSFCQLHWHNLW
jgi:hypothetical protein